MAEEVKEQARKTIPFWVCLISSVGLCIAGFAVPPMGVIDGSVLTAVGMLFGFATLGQLPVIIKTAGNIKMTAAGVTLEAQARNKKLNNINTNDDGLESGERADA